MLYIIVLYIHSFFWSENRAIHVNSTTNAGRAGHWPWWQFSMLRISSSPFILWMCLCGKEESREEKGEWQLITTKMTITSIKSAKSLDSHLSCAVFFRGQFLYADNYITWCLFGGLRNCMFTFAWQEPLVAEQTPVSVGPGWRTEPPWVSGWGGCADWR